MNSVPGETDDQRGGESGGYIGVGASLRQARVDVGEDLPQVAAALCIRRAYLQAIEEGRFSDLPGRVYAIGFLRTYADHLGLDSDWVVDRFREELEPRPTDPDLHFPEAPERGWRPGLGIAAAALAIAAAAYGGWYYHEGRGASGSALVAEVPERLAPGEPDALAASDDGAAPDDSGSDGAIVADAAAEPAIDTPAIDATPDQAAAGLPESPAAADPELGGPELGGPELEGVESAETPEIPEIRIAETTAAPVAAAPLAVPPPAPPAAEEGADSRVVLRVRDTAWVHVSGPGNETVLARNLHPGDVYRVPDRAGLVMTLGNAGGVEVEIDGVPLPPFGARGEVRRDLPLEPDALLAAVR